MLQKLIFWPRILDLKKPLTTMDRLLDLKQPGDTCRKYSTASSAVLLLHVKVPFFGT